MSDERLECEDVEMWKFRYYLISNIYKFKFLILHSTFYIYCGLLTHRDDMFVAPLGTKLW